ncbi:MAG: GNAT family N-acetyltransferase [Pseudomonadota bacterium]|nr:GNAT family N-acetyltransferase [Pseudomonadota bacterium]
MRASFERKAAAELDPADWQAIEALRSGGPGYHSPFFDTRFMRAVARVRPDTVMGVARSAGRIVAAWPLHVARDGWSRPAGAPFADWNGPLIDPASELTPARLLDGLGLTGHTASNMAMAPGGPALHREATRSLVTDLTSGGPAALDALTRRHPRHFKKLRRLGRKLAADHGPVRISRAGPGDGTLDRLLEIKRAQLVRSGLHDVLAPAWVRALLESLHAGADDTFGAELYVLEAGGDFVAAEFNLRSGAVMHGWLAGYDTRFAAYSPGHLLMTHLLPAIAERGVAEYDAGTAEHGYKTYFANGQRTGTSATLFAESRRAAFQPVRTTLHRLETAGPDRLARLIGRSRRRIDQICAAETSLRGRTRGALSAAGRIFAGS